MKKLIISLTLFTSILSIAQIGINTNNPQGMFNIDGGKNNPSSGMPSISEQLDDFTTLSNGRVGIGTNNPTNKLEITSGIVNESGLKFTNLTSSSAVSVSTSKSLSVDSGGNVILVETVPPKPETIGLFAASPSTVRQNISTLSPNFQTVVYQAENVDAANAFNPATGIYTVPLSGTYYFIGSIQFDNTVLPGTPNFNIAGGRIFKEDSSGTLISVAQQFFYPYTMPLLSMTLIGVTNCNAGDKITMRTTGSPSSGGQYSIVASSLQGWRITN